MARGSTGTSMQGKTVHVKKIRTGKFIYCINCTNRVGSLEQFQCPYVSLVKAKDGCGYFGRRDIVRK